MQCKEVMTRYVDCLSPQDTVQVAAERMRDEDVGFLPVCDETNHVIGAVTDRDLAVRVLAEAKSMQTAVSQIMTREVIACRPNDNLSRAEELMAKHQKARIMCLDDSQHLVGVISLADVVHNEEGGQVSQMLRVMKSQHAA